MFPSAKRSTAFGVSNKSGNSSYFSAESNFFASLNDGFELSIVSALPSTTMVKELSVSIYGIIVLIIITLPSLV